MGADRPPSYAVVKQKITPPSAGTRSAMDSDSATPISMRIHLSLRAQLESLRIIFSRFYTAALGTHDPAPSILMLAEEVGTRRPPRTSPLPFRPPLSSRSAALKTAFAGSSVRPRRKMMATARNSNTVRVAIYTRVSTTDQHVEVQAVELRALAAARGWHVVTEYSDVGISGIKASRPGLDSMLRDAALHKFDVLLVWKLDRVGRSLANLLQVIEDLTVAGVGFESAHDPGISTTSATGKLMLSILGAFAAYERGLLIERTRAGVALAKANGKHCGRPRHDLDLRAATILLKQGVSVRQVASMLAVPRGTLQRRLAEVEVMAQKSPIERGADSAP